VLSRWIEPLTLERFHERHLQRAACAGAGVAQAEIPLLDWFVLGRLLETHGLDLITVARGQLLSVPRPHSLTEVTRLLQSGIGFVVRHAERHDAGLRDLAECLAEELPGQTHVQVFVTPSATYGFAWHYDAEDVFIVQTAGVKDYYFRANTVSCADPTTGRHDFGDLRRESSPVQTARLVPGDFLYLPARWWHMAHCVETSLSISIGILPSR
jgi:ribosomal protein L16 Arg81 hydroxylase